MASISALTPLFCLTATSSFGTLPAAISQASSFEEETQPAIGARYFWRNHGITARLDSAGSVAFRISADREIQLRFVGAAEQARPEGEASLGYRTYYYLGSTIHWHSSAGYERVRYREIYPGIDLVFLTKQNQLEYDFELRPGADPRQIRIRYGGAKARLDHPGNLHIDTEPRGMTQGRPNAFQGDRTDPHSVACDYLLKEENDITLRVGRYNPQRPLIIDPVVQFSSYLGGPSFDAAYDVATDLAGNIYVTGETGSASIHGGSSSTRSNRDVWVAKLNANGSQILYLVYLGGSGNDVGKAIAVDSSGNAYITGYTSSTDFPTTAGVFATSSSGFPNAFVVKLDSSGQLQYSTFLGGEIGDFGFSIAVDGSGSAFVAGQTESGSFPVTAGALQGSNHGGLSDCFVSKLNSTGSALIYSTYLGGSGLDLCTGLALDLSGDAYVTGTTSSADFPTKTPMQSNLLGSQNAFVAKINPGGSSLLYSTFLGGSAVDNANAIAVDPTGAAYVAGCTASQDFPTTAGAFQARLQGMYNGFVAKISATGNSLAFSTLIGGSGTDTISAMAIDASGQAVLTGYTSSPNFPLVGATQTSFQSGFDGFAAVLNVAGSRLIFSSYFGGSGDDCAWGVTVSAPNQMVVVGATASTNFPAVAAMQSSNSGGLDAFVFNVKYLDGYLLVPVAPCRVADTRIGQPFGGDFGPPFLAGGASRNFPVRSSACNIPASAQAYSLNITVFPRTGSLQFLTVWPMGGPFPNASTLNSLDGRWVANEAILPAGSGGAISVYASDDTDLIIDINGYFDYPSNTQGLSFYSLPPCRIADTRTGQGKTGSFGPPFLSSGSTRSFPILASGCAIPAAGLYSLNITVFPRNGALGFLTVWGTGQPFPPVSTLNSNTGIVVANAAIVPAGSGGAISVYTTDDTDLIIDINGYFASRGNPGALQFYAVNPCRIADTRSSQGKLGAFGPPSIAGGTLRRLPVPLGGCPAPAWAGAYDFNVTALPSGYLGWITVWPDGQPKPNASTLNSWTGTVTANAAIVPAGAGGAIDVFVSNTTDVVIDLNGYFGP